MPRTSATASSQQNLFTEQAEYLEKDRFEAWTATHPDEELILRKLTQGGAKLLTGPRGSGKTTLLLRAYNRMLRDSRSNALPVYVNFKLSLKLEPLYKSNANAVYWFNQWLLLKVYQGLHETIVELGCATQIQLRYSKQQIDEFVGQLELGQTDLPKVSPFALTTGTLEEDIAAILVQTDRTRGVLLLDDAAHAFSTEQQRDFFDFFRQVKSRRVSPKAAVYPGVTVYSSTFHAGHDAEPINIWVAPDSDKYIEFMESLLQKRFSSAGYENMWKDRSLLHLMCYASFGLPRALLNMVRRLDTEDDESATGSRIKFTKASVQKAIKGEFENTLNLYSSLRVKLPMYIEFVATGDRLYQTAIAGIKEYNRFKSIDRQSVTVAIQRPIPQEMEKLLGFFQYAGLLLPSGDVSRGAKGVFELYIIHYAALIGSNAIIVRKAVSSEDLVRALKTRHPHEFTRFNPRSLVGNQPIDEAFRLSLPPCQTCNTPRVNDSAKFCLNCGSRLSSVSLFASLVNQDISELPLTEARVNRIKESSKLRTIKDILMDYEFQELLSVPRIGSYWAKRIYAYAEEYLA